jgi:GNAT superfamily N-acetyltransferase
MDVRRAGPGDVLELAALRWEWRVDEGGERGLDRPEFEGQFAEWVEGHRDSHLAWLAVDDAGDAVGMAWLAIVDRVPGPGVGLRRAGIVQSVFVRQLRRDHGVGGLLLDHVIACAREMHLDYLTVHPSERSFPLYRRAGFREWNGVLELDLYR